MPQNLTELNAEAWSSVLQEVLLEDFVGMNIANTKFENLFDGADTVHFQRVTTAGVSDMASDTAEVNITDMSVVDETFTLSYRKQHAVKYSIESRVEWNVSPLDENLRQVANSYANAYDDVVMAEYTNAAYDIDDGDMTTATNSGTGNPIKLSVSNTMEFFSKIVLEMDKNNMPKANRFLVLSPYEVALLNASTVLTHATGMGDETIRAGWMGKILGIDIYQSNNLVVASNVRHCMAGAGKPICFAANIKPKVMITPPEMRDDFCWLVKSMTKYGVKTFLEGTYRLIDVQMYQA